MLHLNRKIFIYFDKRLRVSRDSVLLMPFVTNLAPYRPSWEANWQGAQIKIKIFTPINNCLSDSGIFGNRVIEDEKMSRFVYMNHEF